MAHTRIEDAVAKIREQLEIIAEETRLMLIERQSLPDQTIPTVDEMVGILKEEPKPDQGQTVRVRRGKPMPYPLDEDDDEVWPKLPCREAWVSTFLREELLRIRVALGVKEDE